MESVTIPVTKDSVVGTEDAVAGVAVVVFVAVVGVAVGIGVSEKEHVNCNYVFVNALPQESGKSDILKRQVFCYEQSVVTFIMG